MERIKIGKNLYLDPFARCLDNLDSKIFLTQLEFLILSFFSNNLNTVLYVEDILDYINKATSFQKNYTEQNVYVYIQKIRSKLEEDKRNPKILLNVRPGYILMFQS
ncbi:winged helix-turn-helix domain-containing protein [Paenibacillus rhizovicinus]|uniref:Winged helix-turn-helix domain-containing protein n=1 Tax=Paenibacillus rhizovicinus TaxID=2704463 RepID=A0A6C0P0P8_9BACL|nr:helix-turn-helix domain-containing protein [Paenibacillus rhizovicinus]QHW31796.1 winged helix-turn-helix domain-containing protein [Paenibacillus rhizovicinus]